MFAEVTNKAYVSSVTETEISQRFTHKMAAENGEHMYET